MYQIPSNSGVTKSKQTDHVRPSTPVLSAPSPGQSRSEGTN